MSYKVTLPSGAEVTLRDSSAFKQKDRAKLYAVTTGDNAVADGMSMMDSLLAIMIEEWSLDLIIPSVKIENLGELSIPDYDALIEEAEKAMPALFPKFGKTAETESDPKAPTVK